MMKPFKELDQETILKLLEGQENVLTPLVLKEQAFFRAVQCPICQSTNHTQFIDAGRPFAPGAALPTTRLRCKQCEAEFDPYSDLISRFNAEST